MFPAFRDGACADLLDCWDSAPNTRVVRSNAGGELSASVVGAFIGLALSDLTSVSQEECG
jgi:hypothetical protein